MTYGWANVPSYVRELRADVADVLWHLRRGTLPADLGAWAARNERLLLAIDARARYRRQRRARAG